MYVCKSNNFIYFTNILKQNDLMSILDYILSLSEI